VSNRYQLKDNRLFQCNIVNKFKYHILEGCPNKTIKQPTTLIHYTKEKAESKMNTVRIVIEMPDGKEYLFRMNKNTTIGEIKTAISKIGERPAPQRQRLLCNVDGEVIALREHDKTVTHYGLTDDDVILCLVEYFGGGPNFSFCSMENGKTVSLVKRAPNWRSVILGLNWEGICYNTTCKAYKKMVVMHAGLGKFSVGDIKSAPCPMCCRSVKIRSCGIRGHCWYRDTSVSDLDIWQQGVWKSVNEGKYITFCEDKQKQWKQFYIETMIENPNSCEDIDLNAGDEQEDTIIIE
jgi:hypothetical protein